MRGLATAGLVMILAGLGAYYTTEQHSLFSIGNIVLGLALLLVGGGMELSRIRGFSGAFSRGVVVRWVLIVGIVTLAAVIINVAASDWRSIIDLTVERSYSLADQTLEVCQELEADASTEPPELLFFEDTRLARDVELLVQSYRDSCKLISVRKLRLAEAPPPALPLLRAFEVTVLACRSERCEAVGFPSEENITNALLRLLHKRELFAYFLMGHGEVDLAGEKAAGFSGVAASLREAGIEPRGLIGPALKEIPAEASLVVLGAPERNLLPAELATLERYLERGGRLLALLEPGISINLEQLLSRWGFELPQGIVIDRSTSPLLEDPREISLLLNRFDSYHPITRKMSPRTMTLLPGARAVIPAHKPEPEDELHGLVFPSERAWLEANVEAAFAKREITPDPEELRGRTLALAAAGRFPRGSAEARIVVFGDRDFASNRLLRVLYNQDLLLNSVLWLLEDERHVTIRPKLWTPNQDPLTLQQTLTYFYFLAFALPEILLLLGIHAWYRQRS